MMLHPATAHFAMVLPIVAAVFGVIYLFTKTESMSKLSSRTTVIAALAVIGVWYTGTQAGPLIFDFLSPDGKEELLEHKQLGGYIAIAMAIIAVLKFLGCKLKKFGIEALAVILLLGATGAIMLQGKDGGEIVYEHGQPFQMYQLTKYIKTSDDLGFADGVEDALDMVKKKAEAISTETPAKIANEKVTKNESDED